MTQWNTFVITYCSNKNSVEKGKTTLNVQSLILVHFLYDLFCFVLTLSHIQTLSDASWKHCDKGEIAHDEKFHLLQQCFQLYLIITLSLLEVFHIFS